MPSEADTPAAVRTIPLTVPQLGGNEWRYVKESLDTNWVSSAGPFVSRFEQMIGRYLGLRDGVATASGTAALHIALLVAGIKPDEEVLVSTLTFVAPANAIRYVGAWPVLVDSEPSHWQMDVNRIADFLGSQCHFAEGRTINKLTGRRVAGVIPVHILGHPVDMEPLLELAHQYSLVVIEDASESLGARYKGRLLGTLGDCACFSFNGNKILTTGGGGMFVSQKEEWCRRARYLSTQAKDDAIEYIHNEIGYNYRLTNLQAALGCAQFEHLPDFIIAKRKIAEAYRTNLGSIAGVKTVGESADAYSTFWLFTILIDETVTGSSSRLLLSKLSEVGVESRPLWQPVHLNQCHRTCQVLGHQVSEQLHRQALSLPSSVGLDGADIERICDCIKHYLA